MNSFTITLTKGAYVVGPSGAKAVFDAVASGSPHVSIEADILGDGLAKHTVTLVVAHVVSVIDNESVVPGELGSVPRTDRLRLVRG